MAVQILIGDALERLRGLPDGSVHCCVTSPPYYGLRDYGVDGQIGLEETPDAYVARLLEVFCEVRRALKPSGVCFVNIGDSYAGSWGNQGRKVERGSQRPINGSMITPVLDGRYPDKKSNTGKIPKGASYKAKDLLMIPAMLAHAMRADGWYLRDAIVWNKSNGMPESAKDRCTKSYEMVFHLTKSKRYYWDGEAIAEVCSDPPDIQSKKASKSGAQYGKWEDKRGFRGECGLRSGKRSPKPTRNARNVWTIATESSGLEHYAIMPTELARRCILAGCPEGGTVLDPFGGVGTTGLVADRLGRSSILIELNPAHAKTAHDRIHADSGLFAAVECEKAS